MSASPMKSPFMPSSPASNNNRLHVHIQLSLLGIKLCQRTQDINGQTSQM